jgi:hypothetical protein
LDINKGRLSLKEMQVDKNPFHVNTIDLQNSKVLICAEQTKMTTCKNVIIGEKRAVTADEKILSPKVVLKKFANGKESLNTTIKAPILGEYAST